MRLLGRAPIAALAAAAVTLLAPQVAGAAVSIGHSGWNWGNPLPQGNTLRSIEFAGRRGYAAGDTGTLLRTDDGGTTWSGIPTGVTVPLRSVRLLSPDTLVVAGACTVRRSDDGGQSFTRLPWTASDEDCTSPVRSLAFPNGDMGYLVLEDGNLLRTLDGGRSWGRRTAVPGTRSTPAGQAVPNDLAFTTADIGVALTNAGQIYRTTDGGGSWTLVASGAPSLNGVAFVSPDRGYAVGNGGTFLRTIDGGLTWEPKTVTAGTPPLDFTAVRCADALTCMFSVARGDQVVRTTDGGETFTSITPSTQAVFAAAFASPTRAVAVGVGGATVVSDDGGLTWAPIGGRLTGSFSGLEATSSTTAYAFGANGALAQTTDGGTTWAGIGVSTPNQVLDVSFPSLQTGFALDAGGQLLRTDNGGGSWSILDTGTSADPRAVVALNADTVLLVGPRGLRRSTNGGAEFGPVRDRDVARAGLTDIDRVGNAVYVWGRRGKSIALSTDGGRSWRGIPRLPVRTGVIEYDWVSRRIGFAVGNDGRLYRTSDGGRRWSELPAAGFIRLSGLAFSSAGSGYVRPQFGGMTLRTTDGGRSFRPQVVAPLTVTDIASPGGGTDFLLGDLHSDGPPASALLSTTTGGDQGRVSTVTLRPRRSSRRPRRGRRPRTVTVQIDGVLTPPEGGERVTVSMRPAGRGSARSQTVTAASNGRFTTSWRIRGRALFVVRFDGDDDRRGAGSRVLSVTPR